MSAPALLILYTDGAARGNPGPAGAGVSLEDAQGEVLAEARRFLGKATNNQAEYEALILGLEHAKKLGADKIEVRADSELVIKQMLGEYRVRDAQLRVLYQRAQTLAGGFQAVDYVHVRREYNRRADRLANQAIDTGDRG